MQIQLSQLAAEATEERVKGVTPVPRSTGLTRREPPYLTHGR